MKYISGSSRRTRAGAAVLLVCSTMLAGCSFVPIGFYWVPKQFKPMPWIFKQVPEDAPINVKKAWYDGCESGLASMTNTFYRSFYRFQQDPALRRDPTYYKVWKDVFTFCRHYAYGTLREADMRMGLPNSRHSFLYRIGGTQNILEHGLLNMWGPGYEGQYFQNFGLVGGDPYLSDGLTNALDFSGDMVLSKPKGNPSLDWDFRPKDGLFFNETTIELKYPEMKTLTVQPMDPAP